MAEQVVRSQAQPTARPTGRATQSPIPVVGPVQPDPTMQALMGFASGELAREVAKNRDQLFLQGMQKAASGQALSEIVAERPWYSRIFGDGPLIEGAREFEASSRAAQWRQGMVNAMPDLRKVSPEALPQKLEETVAPLLSGDEAADASFRMKVLSEFPDVVKLHTKENFQYLQEEASRTSAINMKSQAAAYQQAMTADPAKVDEVMRQRARAGLFQAADPAGRNDPEWINATQASLVEMARDGNWHAVQAFREAGFFDQLQSADRVQLEAALEAQADAARSSPKALGYQLEFARLRAKAQADGGTYDATRALRDINTLNAKYKAETGNPLDLIDTRTASGTYEGAVDLQYRMLAQAQADAKQKYGDAGAFMTGKEWVLRGMAQDGVNTSLLSTDKMKLAFQDVLNDLQGQPDKQVEVIVNNAKGGYVHQAISDRLQGTLASPPEEPTADFRWAYQQFLDLRQHPDGAVATAQYFGAELDARLGVLQMLNTANPQAFQSNYQMAMRSPRAPAALSDKESAALMGQAATAIGADVAALQRSPGVQRLLQQAGGAYKTYGMALGQDAWAKNAATVAQANGLEFFGDYAWAAPGFGTRTRPLTTIMSVGAPDISSGITTIVRKQAGTVPDDLVVTRNSDVSDAQGNRIATFTAIYGNQRIQFTSADIQREVRASEIRQDWNYGRTNSRDTSFAGEARKAEERARLRRQPLPNPRDRN